MGGERQAGAGRHGWPRLAALVLAVIAGAAACGSGSAGLGAAQGSAPYASPAVVANLPMSSPPAVSVLPMFPVPSSTTTVAPTATTVAPTSTTMAPPPTVAPSVVATATAPAHSPTPTTRPVTTQSPCAAAVAYIAAHGAPGWTTVCGYHAGYSIADCVAAAEAIGGRAPYGCTDLYTLTSYIACPVFVVYANEAENQRYEAGLGGRFDAYGEAPQCAWDNPLGR